MKLLIVVALAAVAVGQQFQQQRQYDTAVRLASPGYFQQGGSFTSTSSLNRNNQLQGNSFQNTFQTATSGINTFRQSGSFQNNNQFQNNAGSNRNQFQTGSVQQSSFDSNASQQNRGNRFQQNSNIQSDNSFFRSGSNQFGSDNRFQTNNNQINSGSRFQSSNQQDNSIQTFDNQRNSASTFSTVNNQQNLDSQFQQGSSGNFQSSLNQQNSNNRFQSSFDNQNSNNRFQSSFDNQNSNNRFQSSFDNQDSNNRFSKNSQSQTTSFLQSRSSFDASSDNGFFEPLNLPSGASALLGGITSSFSCLDRPYGYYADQDNSCRVFHICNPTLFSNGAVETYQYSFMCGEGSVFDQKELTCVAESSAIPCQESSNFLYTNEQFGRPEEKSF
ncbi:putative uncharacterized protein DDB_G0286901 [Penaeus japonicus]|uniref:putative uncharacterized protein DDB_G0286901 n=1 Tax=Penaeus japonicus TaxID=27405 RepID=UPI001C70B290|nr:putative uncharacterized protein DDB_G0286901 [Penaeus japonicus]